jgi:hypothetical protein
VCCQIILKQWMHVACKWHLRAVKCAMHMHCRHAAVWHTTDVTLLAQHVIAARHTKAGIDITESATVCACCAHALFQLCGEMHLCYHAALGQQSVMAFGASVCWSISTASYVLLVH